MAMVKSVEKFTASTAASSGVMLADGKKPVSLFQIKNFLFFLKSFPRKTIVFQILFFRMILLSAIFSNKFFMSDLVTPGNSRMI